MMLSGGKQWGSLGGRSRSHGAEPTQSVSRAGCPLITATAAAPAPTCGSAASLSVSMMHSKSTSLYIYVYPQRAGHGTRDTDHSVGSGRVGLKWDEQIESKCYEKEQEQERRSQIADRNRTRRNQIHIHPPATAVAVRDGEWRGGRNDRIEWIDWSRRETCMCMESRTMLLTYVCGAKAPSRSQSESSNQ
jgi:hypothetical protein